MLSFERQAKTQGYSIIIGIDEAGRGPLAGPVVASAVLPKEYQFDSIVRDSKKMTHNQRAEAYEEIFEKAYVGIGQADHEMIDRINILQATFQAMEYAAKDLLTKIPTAMRKDLGSQVCFLVDGNHFQTSLPFAYKTIINGDGLSLSIACASIIAKVTRDRLMEEYDKVYPQYGFAQHKGYPTLDHKRKVKEFGLCPIHRKTFKYWV